MDDEADRPINAERCRRQLIEALDEAHPDPGKLVHLLFSYITDCFGEVAAHELFLTQGRPKERRELSEIGNSVLLNCYDMQKAAAEASGKKFYVMRFVRDYAKGNESLPAEDRFGAGGISESNLRQHLLTLLRERNTQRTLANRAQAKRELIDLRRVREGAANAGDLTMIQQIDERIEAT